MFQQSEQATALARSIHAEAMRNVERRNKATQTVVPAQHPDVARLLGALRPMVKRYHLDLYKGNRDQWKALERLVRELDK